MKALTRLRRKELLKSMQDWLNERAPRKGSFGGGGNNLMIIMKCSEKLFKVSPMRCK